MKRLSILLAASAACLLLTAAAFASDAPLLSGERLSCSLQVGFGWNTDSDGDFPPECDNESVAALSPAYSLGSLLSLIAPVRIGVRSQALHFDPGVSVLMLDEPGFQLLARATYSVRRDLDNDHGMEAKEGLAVGASAIVPFANRWAVALPASVQLDTGQTAVDVRLSCGLTGKE